MNNFFLLLCMNIVVRPQPPVSDGSGWFQLHTDGGHAVQRDGEEDLQPQADWERSGRPREALQ